MNTVVSKKACRSVWIKRVVFVLHDHKRNKGRVVFRLFCLLQFKNQLSFQPMKAFAKLRLKLTQLSRQLWVVAKMRDYLFRRLFHNPVRPPPPPGFKNTHYPHAEDSSSHEGFNNHRMEQSRAENISAQEEPC